MSLLLAIVASAAAAPADVAVGRWQTETHHGIVEIDRCGGSICGVLVDSDHIRTTPGLLDEHNKDASQRGRRLKGLLMLRGFAWASGNWSGGTIYNPDDGGTYKATVSALDGDHLKVKGCIVWPLCQSQTWVRVR